MTLTFLSHIRKRFFRSSSAGKEIAVQVTIGFIALLIAGYSLAFGFALETIIVKGLNQNNPVVFLNGLLIYYFIGEFVTRYFMQSLPVLDAQPYLHLPVARNSIVHFLLGRSMVHVMNIFVFLLFTPFALSAVANHHGTSQAWLWLISIWFVSMSNHFIVLLFKRNLNESMWPLLGLIVVSGALAASDYYGWFQLSSVSKIIFGTSLLGYTSAAMLSLLVILLYFFSYRFYLAHLYPEELSVQESQSHSSANLTFLRRFGLTGSWIKLELKMIMRHKRTRTVFLTNIAAIFYLLIFYSTRQNDSAYWAWIFFGIIGSGMFVMNYGQYLFSWQSKHFDFVLTQPTSIRVFVASKYWLLASLTGVLFLFSIPYVYLGWSFFLVHLVCSLYNVGINTFVVMNMAMWNPRSLDLTKGGTLNYEGMGAAQWVMGIPVLISPYVFYLPFSLMGYPIAGLLAIGTAGLMGIAFHKKLLDFTARRLLNMRYSIASNFRKD